MQLIRGTHAARPYAGACVVTIGTFDGLHLGHQALIGRLQQQAARLALPAVMLTFEPMPREFLAPADPPARLTTLRERWRILAPIAARLHLCCCASARACVTCRRRSSRNFWRGDVRARLVVVGHDFRFGNGGDGTAGDARGGRRALGVRGRRRAAGDAGRGAHQQQRGARGAGARRIFAAHERLLGRPYTMRGRVVRGSAAGT